MKALAIILAFILIISIIGSYILLNPNSIDLTEKTDTDGDGVYDDDDAFPTDPAASVDTDGDGYPYPWNPGKNQGDSTSNLHLDAFENDSAASVDTDGDGYPDYWNPGKSQSDSTTIPPLELDEYPDDPDIHKDSDKDGVPSKYDINDEVNVSFDIKLRGFEVTSRVNLFRWAQIYFEVKIGDEPVERIPKNDGTFWTTRINQEKNIGHVIHYDLPDRTSKKTTEIEIAMYDYNLIRQDKILDINNQGIEQKFTINFDNTKNSADFSGQSTGSDGVLFYDIIPAESELPGTKYYEKTYEWRYDSKSWEIDLSIPKEDYNFYLNANVNRMPQSSSDPNRQMTNFVTSGDSSIIKIANNLNTLSEQEGYDKVETANFILSFVQQNVDYLADNETKGSDCAEYWRYPVETLVEQEGDCEDSSVLYAAIMDNLGYDVALLFYKWEEGEKSVGHLSVGVHLSGNYGKYVEGGNGKKYFYCETATDSVNVFKLGVLPDKPEQIADGPARIIPV